MATLNHPDPTRYAVSCENASDSPIYKVTHLERLPYTCMLFLARIFTPFSSSSELCVYMRIELRDL